MKSKIEACYDAEEAAKFKGKQPLVPEIQEKCKMVPRKTNKKNKSSPVDIKHIRWMHKNRYKINIDQVPLPFVNEHYKIIQIVCAL